ncbi:MAG TPA: hypothetical protein PLQ68_07940 [Clostridia bacterium]|nr:hypothetical protein [Clostridia bacterium]
MKNNMTGPLGHFNLSLAIVERYPLIYQTIMRNISVLRAEFLYPMRIAYTGISNMFRQTYIGSEFPMYYLSLGPNGLEANNVAAPTQLAYAILPTGTELPPSVSILASERSDDLHHLIHSDTLPLSPSLEFLTSVPTLCAGTIDAEDARILPSGSIRLSESDGKIVVLSSIFQKVGEYKLQESPIGPVALLKK